MQGVIQAQFVSAKLKETQVPVGTKVQPSDQTDIPWYDAHQKEYQNPGPQNGRDSQQGSFENILCQKQSPHTTEPLKKFSILLFFSHIYSIGYFVS